MGALLLALSVSLCFAEDTPAPAQAPPKPPAVEVPKTVSLDTSETLFTVLAMPQSPSASDKLFHFVYGALHIFQITRWDRTLRVVR